MSMTALAGWLRFICCVAGKFVDAVAPLSILLLILFVTFALTAVTRGQGSMDTITGTLEVVEICYTNGAEQMFRLTDENTGEKYRLNFPVKPLESHLTGERVQILGQVRGKEIDVSTGSTLQVLARLPKSTTGLTLQPRSLYGGGTNVNTVLHKTLVNLLVYSDYASNYYTASDIITLSNRFFVTNGASVNTVYLENTYGAVGFTGDVLISHIKDTSDDNNTDEWMNEGDAAAAEQGFNVGGYAHKVYITSGAGGWAGLASVGGNWSLDFYTDGGTICHELGHNLGFNHASSQWNNTNAWNEYGDGSDFMGANYRFQHNNGPHKVQMGWVTAQPVVQAGTYQISRLEDVPGTVPYPQILTVPSSSSYGENVDGWPYYFSYEQNVGFDSEGSPYTDGLSIYRWGGGGDHTAVIGTLTDGGIFTDDQIGLTVKQISHDANSVTVVITTCFGAAQPYTVAMTGAQLAAHTPMPVDVAFSGCDFMTITNFDAISAQGGIITETNNQLFYNPPGTFTSNDTFNYTLVNSSGQSSSSTVTIYNISQPSYNWDANGVATGTGGSGTWDNSSSVWNDGANVWPAGGTANWALFGGAAGMVSIAAGGVAANGLDFKTDGYVIQNNTLALNGISPVVLVEPNVDASINSSLAGSDGFTKLGQGTLTLSGTNNYSGDTILSDGTLSISSATNLPRTSALMLNNGATLLVTTPMTLNNDVTIPAGQSGAIALGPDGGYFTPFLGGDYSGVAGTLILDESASLDAYKGFVATTSHGPVGAVSIVAGSLFGQLGVSGPGAGFLAQARLVLPDKGKIYIQCGNDSGFAGGAQFGGLEGGNTNTLIAADNRIGYNYIINGVTDGDFEGIIQDGGGAEANNLVKTGPGAQILRGANTYTGSTTIEAGKLILNSAQTSAGAISIYDDATLGVMVSGTNRLSATTLKEGSGSGPVTNEFAGLNSEAIAPVKVSTLMLKGTVTINIPTGTFVAGHIYPLIDFSTINGSGGFEPGTLPLGVVASMITNGNSIALSIVAISPFVWTGNVNGTWDINATKNWIFNGSAATYSDGSAVLFDDTATGAATVSNTIPVSPISTVVSNITKNYIIGGAPIAGGTLIKFGSGKLTLSNINTYSSETMLNGGTLSIAAAANLPTTSDLTLQNGAALELTATMTLGNNLTIPPGQSGAFRASGNFGIQLTGDYSNVAGTLVMDSSAATENYTAYFIPQTANGPVGTVQFVAPASVVGQVQVANGGANFFGQAKCVLPAKGQFYVQCGNGSSSSSQFGALAGGDSLTTINADNKSGFNYIINGATNGDFSGIIRNGAAAGANNLIKTGPGTQTLLGANVYTGTTTVSNGALVINGSITGGTVTVVNGTLGGTGTVGGNVIIQTGGTFAPGAESPGTLTLSNSPSLGGRVLMRIQKGGAPNADMLAVGNQSLTYGGSLLVTNVGVNNLAAGDIFKLFSASHFGGGFIATNLPPLPVGLGWAWIPSNGTLTVIGTINTAPTNIMAAVSGARLILNWPADHLGWHLQYQTNPLFAGLGSNWVTVPGSDAITSTNMAIDPSQGSVFYRLVYP
jgi:autotransporter-associated beta strand protein